MLYLVCLVHIEKKYENNKFWFYGVICAYFLTGPWLAVSPLASQANRLLAPVECLLM